MSGNSFCNQYNCYVQNKDVQNTWFVILLLTQNVLTKGLNVDNVLLRRCSSRLSSSTCFYNVKGQSVWSAAFWFIIYVPLNLVKNKTSYLYKTHLNRKYKCWSFRCSYSIACRRCSKRLEICLDVGLAVAGGFEGFASIYIPWNCPGKDANKLSVQLTAWYRQAKSHFLSQCLSWSV